MQSLLLQLKHNRSLNMFAGYSLNKLIGYDALTSLLLLRQNAKLLLQRVQLKAFHSSQSRQLHLLHLEETHEACQLLRKV
jgi:hypothetical protein